LSFSSGAENSSGRIDVERQVAIAPSQASASGRTTRLGRKVDVHQKYSADPLGSVAPTER